MNRTEVAIVAVVTALLALVPWFGGGASATGLFVTHTLVFVLLALALLRGYLSGRVTLGAGWEAPAALGLLAVSLISLLAADYLYGPFLAFWDMLIVVVFAGAMMLAGNHRTLCARVIAAASAGEAICVFVLKAPPNMTPSGTFANANQLAAYLNIGIFLALAEASVGLRTRAWWRSTAGMAIAAVDAAALLRVGARGALIALLIGCAAAALPALMGASRRTRLAVLAIFIGMAVLSAAAVAWRFERFDDPYRFDRLRIWKAGVEAAADHPLLGLGPGMFERRSYRYNFPLDRETFRYAKMPGSTHSTWLQVLAEMGLAGFAATILLVALLGSRLWRLREVAPGPVLALLACLVQGFVDTPFEVPAVSLSLAALIAPLLAAPDPRRASLFVSLAWRGGLRALPVWLALGGALLVGWTGGVLLPYAAWAGATTGRLDLPIRLDPYNPLYHATRAEAPLRRDRRLDPPSLAAAAIDLEEAHRLDPGNPEYLARLARLHTRACFEIGADAASVERALGLYARLVALGIKDPRPRLELGSFLLALGRSDEGIAQLRAALDLEPRYLGARLALVKALLDSTDRDRAAAEYVTLQADRRALASYAPKNGYEADLLRLEEGIWSDVTTRLGHP